MTITIQGERFEGDMGAFEAQQVLLFAVYGEKLDNKTLASLQEYLDLEITRNNTRKMGDLVSKLTSVFEKITQQKDENISIAQRNALPEGQVFPTVTGKVPHAALKVLMLNSKERKEVIAKIEEDIKRELKAMQSPEKPVVESPEKPAVRSLEEQVRMAKLKQSELEKRDKKRIQQGRSPTTLLQRIEPSADDLAFERKLHMDSRNMPGRISTDTSSLGKSYTPSRSAATERTFRSALEEGTVRETKRSRDQSSDSDRDSPPTSPDKSNRNSPATTSREKTRTPSTPKSPRHKK